MAFSNLPKTFDEVKAALLSNMTTKYPAIGVFLENSFLVIFVDIVAYAIAMFMDYADNLFSESKLPTAQNYENARLQAEFYGYTAHRKYSAKGTIRIGMEDSNFSSLPLENVTFEKYDPIIINGVKFLIAESTTLNTSPSDDSYAGLPTGKFYIDVPVIQGQLIEKTFTAKGVQNEKFEISDSTVENTVPEVYVNGDLYTNVDSFFISTPTDTHCSVKNAQYLLGINIEFGDGYRGVQLQSGDSILVKYISTEGLQGQIKSVGFPVIFSNSYEYSDTSPVDAYAVTISQMVGADDIETLESIRYWGQQSVSTIGDAAFQDPEIQLALQEYGGILISKALSEFDINPNAPDPNKRNIVTLIVVPTSGTVLDPVTEQDIRDYLRTRMDFTDFIEFEDPVYLYAYFVIDAEVYTSAPSDLATQINTYLQATYALGEVQLADSVDRSQVIGGIYDNFKTYIKRFSLVLKYTESPTPSIQTGNFIYYTLAGGHLRTGLVNVETCSLTTTFTDGTGEHTEVYNDDGAGSFIPVTTSLFLDNGSIDYITGDINLMLNPSVISVASLVYDYKPYDIDGNLENLDTLYYQIISYGKTSISTEVVKN